MMGREYHRKYSREYYHKRMSAVKNDLGGKCSNCGATDHLEIHHVNPDEKKFDISKKILSIKRDSLNEELSKCILLCHECHKRISDKQLIDRLNGTFPCVVTRPVICVEDNIRFNSITDCAAHYGTQITSIQRVCTNKRKSWHSKHFVYDGERVVTPV